MNGVAADALGAALLPAWLRPVEGVVEGTAAPIGGPRGLRPGALGPRCALFGDFVEHLCTHPAYRLLTLRCVPQVSAPPVNTLTS
jgi:hypothetical protein